MRTSVRRLLLPVLLAPVPLLSPGLAGSAAAQQPGDPIPLSQYQEVVQRVGWAEVSVEYRRPVARGRDLFGALVPFGEPWTPSADSAAVLTLTGEMELAGEVVPPGSYSLWLVPRARGETWTLILSRAARVFHAPYPEGEDLLRVELAPVPSGHMETLAIHFPLVEGPQATLAIHWGGTLLPVPLRLVRPPPGG